MNIPKYIQLDFLLTLLGTFLVGFIGYLIFIKNLVDFNLISFFILGAILMGMGLFEMFDNYFREKKSREMECMVSYLKNSIKHLRLTEEYSGLKKTKSKKKK